MNYLSQHFMNYCSFFWLLALDHKFLEGKAVFFFLFPNFPFYSIKEYTQKEDVVYIKTGSLLCHREEEILPFVTTWMDLEGIMLSERSQRKKNIV